MKKNTTIPGYFFFGILWIFLFNSVGSTFCYGDSASYSYSAHQENFSAQSFGGLKLLSSETGHPFGKFPYEVEEQKEEQEGNGQLLANHAGNKDLYSSKQSISPTYQDFLLTTPQQKRYLLFHQLKIDC